MVARSALAKMTPLLAIVAALGDHWLDFLVEVLRGQRMRTSEEAQAHPGKSPSSSNDRAALLRSVLNLSRPLLKHCIYIPSRGYGAASSILPSTLPQSSDPSCATINSGYRVCPDCACRDCRTA
ncbi:hypothetical protein DOTSEDRAFT_74766 [Dothistroma septosporum NZE10]|uniref:Uncharacterized protein n=1 Tax=Dothistroma septosporum (strain NZE10 / CBS 128990) TaxID=675120 RepID=N1PEH6_DOTSN|nr:hypothetical protein DOTSEDRAFT_74766 [Dothistroma septosporum NZE10]